MILKLHKILKTEKFKVAYHEAGHSILAFLFDDIFEYNILTINKKEAAKYNEKFKGGLNFNWIFVPKPDDYNASDKLALISLGGICSRTIFSKGQKFVIENKTNFSKNSKLLDRTGASDDYDVAINCCDHSCFYLQVRRDIVLWSAFNKIFDFFLLPEIWNLIVKIAEHLIKTPKQTLYQSEIYEFIEMSGIKNTLNTYKENFILSRYPLERNKL